MHTATPLLLTPAQVAAELGVGRSTVYELFASGELRSVKIGSARRVRSADLRAYVEGLS
ncbi:helix-turn-helix domain-containing protein [Curtobacterium sp. PhB115]|uniref:helix-turn-helix domain-containing protein n=1 Tax=Curtobacterium sp. PhB115 TaxID=2485173 RepID=UPI000F4BF878|nr:helix-turn-helix domain-containing protein [Curtobacterium sp. PhB115]ROP74071.1 AlpA family transcriptional regulator [Curtobacterium sp. PhB115]